MEVKTKEVVSISIDEILRGIYIYIYIYIYKFIYIYIYI